MRVEWRQMLIASGLALMAFCASSIALPASARAQEEILTSDWVEGHKSRTRLSAGRQLDANQKPQQLYAFVEIDLSEGWKTYWRSPGDSGIPPRFDFAKSKNLESAKLLYTAPIRITEKDETIIGYTGTVLFPVMLTAADPSQPIELIADIQFGMCKDICVPTEAQLTLAIPSDVKAALSLKAKHSLTRVPRSGDALTLSDPRLATATAELASGLGKISVKAVFPGGGAKADAFLEAPEGLYLPYLVKKSESGDEVTFEADVTKDVDVTALRGKVIGLTLTSPVGASEASFTFE